MTKDKSFIEHIADIDASSRYSYLNLVDYIKKFYDKNKNQISNEVTSFSSKFLINNVIILRISIIDDRIVLFFNRYFMYKNLEVILNVKFSPLFSSTTPFSFIYDNKNYKYVLQYITSFLKLYNYYYVKNINKAPIIRKRTNENLLIEKGLIVDQSEKEICKIESNTLFSMEDKYLGKIVGCEIYNRNIKYGFIVDNQVFDIDGSLIGKIIIK